jgi:hypothetical protein
MSTLRLELEGDAQVRQALRQVSADLDDLKQANSDTSQIVTAAARGVAPKRTGRLAASGRATPETGAAVITFTVPYANPIHWGWRARHIAAQPFAMTAAEATQPTWLRRYEDNIQAIARREGLDG